MNVVMDKEVFDQKSKSIGRRAKVKMHQSRSLCLTKETTVKRQTTGQEKIFAIYTYNKG